MKSGHQLIYNIIVQLGEDWNEFLESLRVPYEMFTSGQWASPLGQQAMFVMIESPQNTQTLHFPKWNIIEKRKKRKKPPHRHTPFANSQVGISIKL